MGHGSRLTVEEQARIAELAAVEVGLPLIGDGSSLGSGAPEGVAGERRAGLDAGECVQSVSKLGWAPYSHCGRKRR